MTRGATEGAVEPPPPAGPGATMTTVSLLNNARNPLSTGLPSPETRTVGDFSSFFFRSAISILRPSAYWAEAPLSDQLFATITVTGTRTVTVRVVARPFTITRSVRVSGTIRVTCWRDEIWSPAIRAVTTCGGAPLGAGDGGSTSAGGR